MPNIILAILLLTALCSGTPESDSKDARYRWSRVTTAADYPQGYNYPVYVFGNWMVALNNGAWLSRDGRKWRKTDLPESGLNSAYQKYVQFNGAIYALGKLDGNYERFTVSTKIQRTKDFNKWETVAETSNLPQRIFYGAAVFGGKIWIVGGYDGKNYLNDAWNSPDGIHWTRVAEKTAWSPRVTGLIVFKNQLWLLGGGVIDGHANPNPDSGKEIWISDDGSNWREIKVNPTGRTGGTAIVFDNKLWMIGGNRNDGNFGNAYSVSDDGINWRPHSAPWSPRGGVAVWEFDGKLYMTGGKYSHTENGVVKFVYSNDVWALTKKKE